MLISTFAASNFQHNWNLLFLLNILPNCPIVFNVLRYDKIRYERSSQLNLPHGTKLKKWKREKLKSKKPRYAQKYRQTVRGIRGVSYIWRVKYSLIGEAHSPPYIT